MDDMMNEQYAFARLDPEQILDAVDSVGYRCDGHLFALNSYENRVYQVGVEGGLPLIAKFYRPQRWTDEAILEEHAFALQLAELEIPVVPPLAAVTGDTLFHHGPFRFALYARHRGGAPDLDNPDHLTQLGRFLGRLHGVGRVRPFHYRPMLDIDRLGKEPSQYLLESGFIPVELESAYRSLTADLLLQIQACYDRAGPVARIRLHGDCHPGNILWGQAGPVIVDLDDACTGPAIQDLWMFLSGNRRDMTAGLADLLDGYTRFQDFDPRELHLIEALRTLRMMHYAAWLARRWQDPAFQLAFPWFNTSRYWDEHILSLREQAALLQEPPLVWE